MQYMVINTDPHNWSMCRYSETVEYSASNGTSRSHPSSRDHFGKESRKSIKARVGDDYFRHSGTADI